MREASGTEGMRRPPPADTHHRANPPRGESEEREGKRHLSYPQRGAKNHSIPLQPQIRHPDAIPFPVFGKPISCALIGPRSLFSFLYALLVLSKCLQVFWLTGHQAKLRCAAIGSHILDTLNSTDPGSLFASLQPRAYALDHRQRPYAPKVPRIVRTCALAV